MILAAAQTIAIKGNIEENIKGHVKLIEQAAADSAELIFFPELSLTGYEPELAKELAITLDDERLTVFRQLAISRQIIIAVGAPVKEEVGILIGMIIFMPDGTLKLYTKQHLHPGEEQYFVPQYAGLQLDVKGKIIGFAICADFSHPEHAKHAAEKGANVYLASVLISKNGLKHDMALLKSYAETYHMTIVMSNYGGISGGYNCAGNTAAWSKNGILQDYIMGDREGLLIIDC